VFRFPWQQRRNVESDLERRHGNVLQAALPRTRLYPRVQSICARELFPAPVGPEIHTTMLRSTSHSSARSNLLNYLGQRPEAIKFSFLSGVGESAWDGVRSRAVEAEVRRRGGCRPTSTSVIRHRHLRRRIQEFTRSGCFVWYSANTVSNGRGSPDGASEFLATDREVAEPEKGDAKSIEAGQ
jgi:hypothetical protein